jgi:hypothetical protein
MEPDERSDQRAGILSELGPLLRDAFALDAWGRLLVFVERKPDGSLRVCDLQVEEILDERLVETAFEGLAARTALPALASAVEALTLLDDLELADLGGGTFVRLDEGVAWIAGCVRTPSPSFDARRDGSVSTIRAKNVELLDRFEIGGAAVIEADMLLGTARAVVGGVNRATCSQVVLGSFSRRMRSWVWGAHNPTLTDPARRRSAGALDQMRDRSMWEISTPGFVTDEATAWALAALVADEVQLSGVARVETKEGFVLLGLTEVVPATEIAVP